MPGRRSSSNFTLEERGSPRLLAIAAVTVAYKAKGAKPNYN